MTSLPKVFTQLVGPASILPLWSMLKAVPGGGVLMGRLIGRLAPYTGSIKPEFEAIEIGYARVKMRDRKGLRNHLQCVHAIALLNLGEVATGVAMNVSLPAGVRGIIVHLSMDYFKKARGTITCECTCTVPSSTEREEYVVTADLKDEAGVVVSRCTARWLIGP